MHIRARTLKIMRASPVTTYSSSEEATAAGTKKEMAGKKARASAIAAVCVLLLLVTLSGQQQVAASARSEFCACYKECYPGCRHHVPRLGCMLFCTNKCCPSQAANAAAGGGSCRAGCAGIRICGLSDPSADPADAAACVQNCNEKWSHGPTE